MRRLASPVTVVTVAHAEERRAATIGSFTSVSLEPPLVSFNVMRGTGFHGVLLSADRLAIHMLRDDQADLAKHFAVPDMSSEEQFRDIALRPGSQEMLPILRDALAVLWCRPFQVYPAGDHDLMLAIVERVEGGDVEDGRGPLVYVGQSYRAVGDEV